MSKVVSSLLVHECRMLARPYLFSLGGSDRSTWAFDLRGSPPLDLRTVMVSFRLSTPEVRLGRRSDDSPLACLGADTVECRRNGSSSSRVCI